MSGSKVALVTGANRGIGFEIARQLLERDFIVYLACRSRESGEAAAKTLGANARPVPLDVTDPASVERAVRQVSADFDRLDVLINNAGILGPGDDSVITIESSAIERTFRTNTIGPLIMIQAFLPLLNKSPAPRVINLSSGGGSLTEMSHWAPAYSISKAALNVVTRQFAAALHGKMAGISKAAMWVLRFYTESR